MKNLKLGSSVLESIIEFQILITVVPQKAPQMVIASGAKHPLKGQCQEKTTLREEWAYFFRSIPR
jgi:hypothetical protein